MRLLSLIVAVLLLAGCTKDSPPGSDRHFEGVEEIIAVLREDGISCENLRIRDKKEIAQDRAADPDYSPRRGSVSIPGIELAIKESGLCKFEGSPELLGQKLDSIITVYEDDEHLEYLPDRAFPGAVLIYGDNWAITLSAANLAQDVARSLNGRLIPPSKVPLRDAELVEQVGPRCFFIAALPPGLAAVGKQAGLPIDEPEDLARMFGEMAYYRPPHVQKKIAASCRFGLKVDKAIRQDSELLHNPRFKRFWLKVCKYVPGDFQLTEKLGFGEGFGYTELGRELTVRFLKDTSLQERERRSLSNKCGKEVEEGVTGDLD